MKRGRLHPARRWARLLATSLLLLLTLFGLAAPAGARPAAPAPTVPSASSPGGKSLTIGVQVGKLHVGVTVPLTLPGLLGHPPPAKSSTPPPTARPTTASPYPPTMPNPIETPTATRTHATPSGHPASPGSSTAASRPPSSQHPSTSPSRHKTSSENGLVFVKRLAPSPGVLILIVLCALCAVGVGFVVRLSGGRRRL